MLMSERAQERSHSKKGLHDFVWRQRIVYLRMLMPQNSATLLENTCQVHYDD